MSKASCPSDSAGGSRWHSPNWGAPRRKRSPDASPAHGSPSASTRARWNSCVKTGAAIARACGLAAGEARDDLNDIDYGRWQFKTFEDAKADDPALFAAWFKTPQLVRFPGGES